MSPTAAAGRVALITGASAGIGAAYAQTLAREGYDLVLVARRGDRLEGLARELREREGRSVECIAADLSDEVGIQKIEERIAAGPPIDLLINNAARGSFGRVWDLDVDADHRLTTLNAVALLRISHAALRRMVPSRRGALILVGSISGYQPGPFAATYSASKAFVNSLAHALREELRGTGVRVQLLCPGFTRTEFQQNASVPAENVPGFAWGSAEAVVTASLRALQRDRFLCIPGAFNKLLGGVMRLAPAALGRRVQGWITRPMVPPPEA